MSFRFRGYGLYVLGILALVNLLNYAVRNHIFAATIQRDLATEFALSASQLGLLGTVFMAGHALATVPLGWLADRYDRRWVMACGIGAFSAATLAAALAPSYSWLLLTRAIAGVGTAACVPIANAMICDVFPSAHKARAVSIFNVGLLLGGAAGYSVGQGLGAPLTFLCLGLPGAMVVVAVLRLRLAQQQRSQSVAWLKAGRGFVRDVGEVLSVRTLRWLLAGCIIMAFAAGSLVEVAGRYIVEQRQLSGTQFAVATPLLALCGLAGVISGGVVADRLHARMASGRLATICLGFALCVPLAALGLWADSNWVFVISCASALYFLMWYHAPVAAVVDDVVHPDRASTAQAVFTFIMHLCGTAPAFYVMGVAADRFGEPTAIWLPIIAIATAAVVLLGGLRHVAKDCAIKGAR